MIKLVSSNIRFDNPKDNEHAWGNRKDSFKQIITSLSPDYVGTQEGREPQLREVESLLSLSLIDNHRNWIDIRMYPTIFTNQRPSQSGDIWLSTTPNIPGSKSFNSAYPRLCTWAKFSTDNKEFFIFNLHLDNIQEFTRVEQSRVLIREVKKITGSHPFILMGDFNCPPDTNVYNEVLNELSLTDPWRDLSVSEESSYHLFKGENSNGARIDWILHSSEFKSKKIKLIKMSNNGIYPSDHFPLYCELDFI